MSYGPTQDKLLEILQDGEFHTRKELHEKCLPDCQFSALSRSLSYLRENLRARGLNIVCVLVHRRLGYQIVRNVRSLDSES